MDKLPLSEFMDKYHQGGYWYTCPECNASVGKFSMHMYNYHGMTINDIIDKFIIVPTCALDGCNNLVSLAEDRLTHGFQDYCSPECRSIARSEWTSEMMNTEFSINSPRAQAFRDHGRLMCESFNSNLSDEDKLARIANLDKYRESNWNDPNFRIKMRITNATNRINSAGGLGYVYLSVYKSHFKVGVSSNPEYRAFIHGTPVFISDEFDSTYVAELESNLISNLVPVDELPDDYLGKSEWFDISVLSIVLDRIRDLNLINNIKEYQ